MSKSSTLKELHGYLKPKPLQTLPPHDRLIWELVPANLHNAYHHWYIEIGFVCVDGKCESVDAYFHHNGAVYFWRGDQHMSLADLKRVVLHAPFSLLAEMRGDEKLGKLKSLCAYLALCAEHISAFVETGGMNAKKLQAAMTIIWQVMKEDEDEEHSRKRAASSSEGEMEGVNKGKKGRLVDDEDGIKTPTSELPQSVKRTIQIASEPKDEPEVQRTVKVHDDDAPLAIDDDDAAMLAEMKAAYDDSPVEEDDSVHNDAYPQVESDDESVFEVGDDVDEDILLLARHAQKYVLQVPEGEKDLYEGLKRHIEFKKARKRLGIRVKHV